MTGTKKCHDNMSGTPLWACPTLETKLFATALQGKISEFYGKRGINWHVTAVIRKTPECSLSVEVFVHIFDSCDQDQIAVASITQNTLSTLRKLYPELTGVYIRSDNAGCYHGGYLLTSLPSVGHETGIRVIGYDFSKSLAKLNMAKTYAIERQQQRSNM